MKPALQLPCDGCGVYTLKPKADPAVKELGWAIHNGPGLRLCNRCFVESRQHANVKTDEESLFRAVRMFRMYLRTTQTDRGWGWVMQAGLRIIVQCEEFTPTPAEYFAYLTLQHVDAPAIPEWWVGEVIPGAYPPGIAEELGSWLQCRSIHDPYSTEQGCLHALEAAYYGSKLIGAPPVWHTSIPKTPPLAAPGTLKRPEPAPKTLDALRSRFRSP